MLNLSGLSVPSGGANSWSGKMYILEGKWLFSVLMIAGICFCVCRIL